MTSGFAQPAFVAQHGRSHTSLIDYAENKRQDSPEQHHVGVLITRHWRAIVVILLCDYRLRTQCVRPLAQAHNPRSQNQCQRQEL